jgi:hypothetical protein
MTAASNRYLRTLVFDGVLSIAFKGSNATRGKATEFRYITSTN